MRNGEKNSKASKAVKSFFQNDEVSIDNVDINPDEWKKHAIEKVAGCKRHIKRWNNELLQTKEKAEEAYRNVSWELRMKGKAFVDARIEEAKWFDDEQLNLHTDYCRELIESSQRLEIDYNADGDLYRQAESTHKEVSRIKTLKAALKLFTRTYTSDQSSLKQSKAINKEFIAKAYAKATLEIDEAYAKEIEAFNKNATGFEANDEDRASDQGDVVADIHGMSLDNEGTDKLPPINNTLTADQQHEEGEESENEGGKTTLGAATATAAAPAGVRTERDTSASTSTSTPTRTSTRVGSGLLANTPRRVPPTPLLSPSQGRTTEDAIGMVGLSQQQQQPPATAALVQSVSIIALDNADDKAKVEKWLSATMTLPDSTKIEAYGPFLDPKVRKDLDFLERIMDPFWKNWRTFDLGKFKEVLFDTIIKPQEQLSAVTLAEAWNLTTFNLDPKNLTPTGLAYATRQIRDKLITFKEPIEAVEKTFEGKKITKEIMKALLEKGIFMRNKDVQIHWGRHKTPDQEGTNLLLTRVAEQLKVRQAHPTNHEEYVGTTEQFLVAMSQEILTLAQNVKIDGAMTLELSGAKRQDNPDQSANPANKKPKFGQTHGNPQAEKIYCTSCKKEHAGGAAACKGKDFKPGGDKGSWKGPPQGQSQYPKTHASKQTIDSDKYAARGAKMNEQQQQLGVQQRQLGTTRDFFANSAMKKLMAKMDINTLPEDQRALVRSMTSAPEGEKKGKNTK